jgi:4,5-dihydroxyphthalate decarboxylase
MTQPEPGANINQVALTAALCDYEHVRDLAQGRVIADGIRLTCLSLPVEEIFYRFLMFQEWDVSELSMAKYVAMRAAGDERFMALPVFPSRVFRHSSLYVRTDGPVRSIGDLAGRRVGLPEWAQTAAVYSRGFLAHQFRLDLVSIDWVQAGVNDPGRKEKVELTLPPGIRLTPVPDRSLNDMLLAGEIDAVLAARPPAAFSAGDPRIRRLFEDSQKVEEAYYRDTGIFPIMHTVVIRKEVLDSHPWVAANLFKAFEEARQRSIARVLDDTVSLIPIPWGSEYAKRGGQLFGEDYFPYGIEANRRTLSAFLGYAHEQGVCRRLLEVEELFPPQLRSSFKV